MFYKGIAQAAGLTLAVTLCGCAIAPNQQEVTHVTTAQIVRSIRCETRDAIRGQLASYLDSYKDDLVAQHLASKLRDRRIPVSDIDLRGLNWNLKREIASFKNYAVAYDFTFDGKITNNLSGGVNPVQTFTAGNRAFPFTAEVDRTRQNIVTFGQTDTFGNLLKSVRSDYCSEPYVSPRSNYIYPISGKIGISTLLTDFLAENELGSPKPSKDGASPYVATISFTTLIQGTVKPTITINPVVGETTTGGNYGLDSSRTDMHQVIVSFAPSVTKMTDAEVDAFLAPNVLKPNVTAAKGKSVEEGIAKDGIAESILRFQIGRQAVPVIVNRPFISVF